MANPLSTPFPLPASPLVDPQTGVVTDAWLQFLMVQFARTGGAKGSSTDLGSVSAALVAANLAVHDAQVLAVIAEGQEPQQPPVSIDQAALLAMLLAETDQPQPAPLNQDALLIALLNHDGNT